MKISDIVRFSIPAMMTAMMMVAVSCNEKNDPEEDAYGADSSVAVTSFKLKANAGVIAKLDTLFFSIDLDHGVIFNADSLPMGTDVTGLVPVITYPSTVSEAVIIMEGGEKRFGEIDYLKNPSDTVDFTGDVRLRLRAQNKDTERTYRIKVNVHKLPSDTLMWDAMGASTLPSACPNPVEQKALIHHDAANIMVREADGALTFATAGRPGAAAWQLSTVQEQNRFDVRTFCATDDTYYILDTDGQLYSSADAVTWIPTGQEWVNVIGGYGHTLLGIAWREGRLHHTSWPHEMADTPLEPSFPIRDFSNVGMIESKWSTSPVAMISGGLDADGNRASALWAFDGATWTVLATDGPNSLTGATLIPYYAYRSQSVSWMTREYNVWLLTGGVDTEGNLNRNVWVSYDNGVRWQQAVDYLQLPDFMPSLQRADALVMNTDLTASLSDYWTRIPSRRLSPWMVKAELDGTEISWQCPYIYLIGGIDADSHLNPTIWRGVLNRLTFTPML